MAFLCMYGTVRARIARKYTMPLAASDQKAFLKIDSRGILDVEATKVR